MNTVKNSLSFAIKLDRFFESLNTLIDLSNKVCIQNKTKDLKLR